MLLGNKHIVSIYYFISLTSRVHIPQISYHLCLKEKKMSIRKVVSVTYIIDPMVIDRHIVIREYLFFRGNYR